ncbi:MAG: alpha/beta hydrolase family protein [Planctomycetota bacterium]
MRFGPALTLSVLVVLVGAAHVVQAEQPSPTCPDYPDHADLSVFRDAGGVPRPVRTAEDWSVRRRHIVAGMEQAMGPLPDRKDLPPLAPETVDRVEGDGFTRLTIRFTTEPGDRLSAHLYLPDGCDANHPAPAMLALHPTSRLGKDRVTEEGGKPNRMYAFELARRGYVVLAPDYPSFGDSADYDFSTDQYASGTMKGIFNHMRCCDLLRSRPEVDPRRIGVIGHSLGGHNAMFLGVFDTRVKVIVSSCGWTPFHDYYGGQIEGWTSDRYMPRLREVYELDPDRVPFDFYEVVAALAPRAFFSSSPLHDHNFDVAGVRKAEPVARQVFQLLDAEENLKIVYPDCRHDFPPAVRRKAYAFVDGVLKQ